MKELNVTRKHSWVGNHQSLLNCLNTHIGFQFLRICRPIETCSNHSLDNSFHAMGMKMDICWKMQAHVLVRQCVKYWAQLDSAHHMDYFTHVSCHGRPKWSSYCPIPFHIDFNPFMARNSLPAFGKVMYICNNNLVTLLFKTVYLRVFQ